MSVVGISSATIRVGKLDRNESVNNDVFVRICEALDFGIGDIMEVLKDL